MSTKPPSTTVRTYLLLYNALCLTLWTTITLRLFLLLLALLLPPTAHLPAIHAAFFPLLQVTQSLALLEIVHAAMGIVRAALGTTAMQVASRLVVVYGVMGMFAGDGEKRGILGGRETRARVGDWGFVGCVTAWGVTECVSTAFLVLG
ncbi:protein tyrosine phosphatase-like protein [Emydomyces testavorans]|uniref:Very-long-chain (3R)-3-hydroxyacyl-CoA dehydratase n=1 Tax=Emydomyces testavorans TaxID=2070801 RepID=A0AAF0DNZ1_9EURO|nr:protein tyrosine phosphatase-like protein [Emydomyces testavorans]